jgi:hypothetical protein
MVPKVNYYTQPIKLDSKIFSPQLDTKKQLKLSHKLADANELLIAPTKPQEPRRTKVD